MGKNFKLAHRWGCVLLLDEADVFLAKRDKQDVKRNGLVSCKLRCSLFHVFLFCFLCSSPGLTSNSSVLEDPGVLLRYSLPDHQPCGSTG